MLPIFRRVILCVSAALLTIFGAWSLGLRAERGNAQTSLASSSIDPAILKAFQWRSIGPLRGGRSITVSGVKGKPKEAYFGATGGGLWNRRPDS
jgi:hypothetical protein